LGSFYLIVKPVRIALIVLLAIVARVLLHRMINRVVRHASTDEQRATLLRPIRNRLPGALRETTGTASERRRQRAAALGSVLRSIASVSVSGIAAMLVLGQLGIDLAPLIASAGIVGVAIGFGAQNLVKDFVSGLFMLLEDQYGVGDVIDLGSVNGTVESVGLRITTLRDVHGVVWYVRNGEIVRVGNKSQGWAQVVVDVPVDFAEVHEASRVLKEAAAAMAADPDWMEHFIEVPTIVGVEQITADGAVLRITAKTPSPEQWRVARELRSRLTGALADEEAVADPEATRAYVEHAETPAPDGSPRSRTDEVPVVELEPPARTAAPAGPPTSRPDPGRMER
jgi:small conductance mechanosensitive channel